MSIGIAEKRVLYDNPCAPIVKFTHKNSNSNTDDETDDEDMTNDQSLSNTDYGPLLNATLG